MLPLQLTTCAVFGVAGIAFYEFGASKLLTKYKREHRDIQIYMEWAVQNLKSLNDDRSTYWSQEEVEKAKHFWSYGVYKNCGGNLAGAQIHMANLENRIQKIEKYSLTGSLHYECYYFPNNGE